MNTSVNVIILTDGKFVGKTYTIKVVMVLEPLCPLGGELTEAAPV